MTNPPHAPVTPVPQDAAVPANAPVLVEAPGSRDATAEPGVPVSAAVPGTLAAPAPGGVAGPLAPARLAYRLLSGPDDRTFCERVSAALADGYRLYGSPSVTFDGERVIVAQAVVLAGGPGDGPAGRGTGS